MIIMRNGARVIACSADLTPSQEVAVSFEGQKVDVVVRQLDGTELMQFMGYSNLNHAGFAMVQNSHYFLYRSKPVPV
jgi:hypothetical protein